jgi:SAM-dependent methyltransferase
MAQDGMILALRALLAGDRGAALSACRSDPSSLLAAALARHLEADTGGGRVYDQPAAFQAFISGGGNVGLYDATAKALTAVYDAFDEPSVLDIGCGDGAALVPALAQAKARPARLDLVELSAPLLDAAVQALSALGQPSTPHAVTAQEFTAALHPEQRWDVAESTFALHTLPYDERTAVLSRLHAHVDKLVVIEFDVPDHDPRSYERLAFLADSYEQGLAEYTEDRDLIASGFLMPVLVGQLAPGAARVTYEQPSAAWEEQLRNCGYSDVERHDLFPYWSSPAFVVTGVGGAVPRTASTS